MVVATPELVAFSYEIAGLGSRFLAALLDTLLLLIAFIVLGIGAFVLGTVTSNGSVAILLFLLGFFLLAYGYYWVQEAAFNGQTLGKRAARLRVVGDRGEPITFTQAGIRNLIRFVDFLPAYYAVGIIALFINGRGKRLGDLAAGTLVVRERQRVRLQDLPTTAPPEQSTALPVNLEDPELRRFLATYVSRRAVLDPGSRRALALQVEPLLRRWAPDILAGQGPEAALDALAFRSAPPPGPPQ